MSDYEAMLKAMVAPYEAAAVNAHNQGVIVGEIALAEFLLNNHSAHMDLEVKVFLRKVLDTSYKDAEKAMGKPAEDIALIVSEAFGKVG
jgi:hypothetical protein